MMTWKRIGLVAALAFAPAVASAQDSLEVEGPRAERLRALIEERFTERLAAELGLSDEVAARTRGILQGWAGKRRGLERDERRNRAQLAAAMRPGVAANDQAVTRLIDAILAGRQAYVQTFRDEMTELATVLTPVQRAQYILLRDRLMQRVQEIRNQRQGDGPSGRFRNRPPR
jgi:hypothetical protein